MEVEIGIEKKACEEVAETLSRFLADTYALYLKTQNFHWNLVGPEFISLHLLFEKQYEDMADGVDEIAERIRSLGIYVQASFSAFQKKASIPESNHKISSKQMLKELLDGHEAICRLGRPLITRTQELHDDITADLVIRRMAFHEKAAWMLRSHLE